LPVVLGAQWVLGWVDGLYRGRWLSGSFDELPPLAGTVGAVTALLVVVDFGIGGHQRSIPLSAAVGAGFMAFVFMGGVRAEWRRATDRRRRPADDGRTRVLIFGAGSGGERALEAMLQDPHSPYVPVALLDDDSAKLGLSIRGVHVVGDRGAMTEASERHAATVLLVAVPTADSALLRDLLRRAEAAGLDVRVLPSVRELLGGEVRVIDMRELNDVDMLGRNRVETDLSVVCEYLAGRVVAVTGAGGSIGSELCRQITAFAPAELIMIDRDESALHAVQMSLDGRGLLDSDGLVLVDIRDRDRVARLFASRRPDVVFHAAALKHLPLLESHPVEALKTNVWGTRAVLDAAAAAGVERLVNISTDKAANPCSVLGYSKRICEGLTAHVAEVTGRSFVSVRFGNVLESRGSVLTAFRAQIKAGGPITVTHPNVARYFMTIEEAVELVLQAGAVGCGGEVLVLEMGEPVRIADVARRLAAASNPPIRLEFTGLRPGEKVREELLSDTEVALPSSHPLITAVEVPPLCPDLVTDIDATQGAAAIAELLRALSDEMAERLADSRPRRARRSSELRKAG
jgi:FlaA1/EpsC-like NDP-sugar epimerase